MSAANLQSPDPHLALDEAARVKLAASQTTPFETLSTLARDPAVTVRAAVALNLAACSAADQILASDGDERVRLLLTRKMLTLLPNLSSAEQDRLRDQTFGVLSTLVQDEAIRIRVLIAEVLAELPDVPHALILTLAQDAAIPVSEPVLRLSPLLSAADLLGLLQAPPNATAAAAIAHRADLPETVSEIIAASADTVAIRTLLANPSAAIRESTLDSLIARAALQPDWHAPLVYRPCLPDHAARALSEIVASHLLEVLANRTDLGAATVTEIKHRLTARLAQAPPSDPAADAGDEGMLEVARRLEALGTLGEAALLEAAAQGEARRTAAMLAVAAGVPLPMVDRAASLRSAKALVSLVWKAGYSMRVAGPVQALLGQLGPTAILHAGPDAGFPLGADEMMWQIDFLGANNR